MMQCGGLISLMMVGAEGEPIRAAAMTARLTRRAEAKVESRARDISIHSSSGAGHDSMVALDFVLLGLKDDVGDRMGLILT